MLGDKYKNISIPTLNTRFFDTKISSNMIVNPVGRKYECRQSWMPGWY